MREATIEFPERGLVFVRGINTAAKGKMVSIGSGKTALGEAISRALFGVKGRYNQLGNYSTQGKGDAYVCVQCLHNGTPLKVELGFKCQEISTTGEGLKFKYGDNNEVYRGRIEQTREDLVKVLTVPPDLASWTVHLDGDALKFNDLTESKSVDLLMAALMQPRWNVCSKQTNDKASELKRQLGTERINVDSAKEAVGEAEVELQTSKANLSEAKNVYAEEVMQAKAQLAQIEKMITETSQRMLQRQARMKEIKKEIERRTSATAEKLKACEIAVNEKQDAFHTITEELADLRVEEGRLKRDYDHAVSRLDTAKRTPANCPTCANPWDRGEKEVQEWTTRLAKAKAAYDNAAKTTAAKRLSETKVTAACKAAREKLEAAKQELPTEELSQEYEELEDGVRADQSSISEDQQEKIRIQHGPDKTSITTFEAQCKEREKVLKKAQQNVDRLAAKVVETEELLRVVNYWQDAFGPTGIPNMVLGDALGPLNATSRRISALMSGGTLSVSYATSRTLKTSGAERAELTINVKNELGSHRADGSSKGEAGLNNLIIAETLAEVGGIAHRIGYRWYDEVGGNQDEIVRRSIYSYLSEIAQRYGILVFLVSHAPEAANYADYTLVAEKTAAGTRYFWT